MPKPVTVHVGTVIGEEIDGFFREKPVNLVLTIRVNGVGEDSALLTSLGKGIVLSRSVDELMENVGPSPKERAVIDAALAWQNTLLAPYGWQSGVAGPKQRALFDAVKALRDAEGK